MDETIDTGDDSSGYDYFFSGDNGTSGTGTDTSSVDPTAVDPSKTYYDQAEGVTYYKNAAGQIISTRTDTGAVSTVDPATGTITSSSGGIASGTDNSGIFSGLKDTLSKAGVSQSVLDKVFSGAGLATLLGGIAGGAGALYGGSSGTNSGAYTGTIPKYTVARQQVANAYDPTRRPGSGGQYYLTDAQYTPAASTSAADVAAAQAISKQSAANQAAQLAEINRANPFRQTPTPAKTPTAETTQAATTSPGLEDKFPMGMAGTTGVPAMSLQQLLGSRGTSGMGGLGSLGSAVSSNPTLMQALQRQQATYQQRQQAAQDQGLADMEEGGDLSSLRGGAVPPGVADPNKYASAPTNGLTAGDWTPGRMYMYASGGLTSLAKGRYLAGGTDGMADKINTTIDGDQPAKLSHGEFVVPADVVSHLGNGNSDAGAQRLYDMMDKIRKARTGTTKQGKQIKPDKYLPS